MTPLEQFVLALQEAEVVKLHPFQIALLRKIDREMKRKELLQIPPPCSAYDCDCADVDSPWQCWAGDAWSGPADGYCVQIFGEPKP